jgi:hypothetical protein
MAAMNLLRPLFAVVVVASLGINAYFAAQALRGQRRTEVQLASPDRVEVIRTKGGVLQVSSIKSPETFQASTDHKFLGIDLGKTVTQIRVPAVFHYHVDLAPEWKVTVKGDTVIVIAPAVKATLPVGIDTARLERFSAGTWSLFTGTSELDLLQRSITQTLAVKAMAPGYIQFQREAARQTVTEFVARWLLTQERHKALPKSAVRVFFADEPITSLNGVLPAVIAAP